MIKVQVTGAIPQVAENFEEAFRQVKKIMLDSVLKNFDLGGRPPWLPAKPSPLMSGGKTLVRTGTLLTTVRAYSDGKSATVEAGRGIPYARAQNFGATFPITVTARMRSFFWYLWFETGDEKWKSMALSRRSVFVVHIPARPFMVFQSEDIEAILAKFSTSLWSSLTLEQSGVSASLGSPT